MKQNTKKLRDEISDIEAEVRLLSAVLRDMHAFSQAKSTEQESEVLDDISTQIEDE